MANLEAIIAEKSQQDNQWRAEMQADRENTIAMQDARSGGDHQQPGTVCEVPGYAGG